MTNEDLKRILTLLGLLAIAGCGGGSGGEGEADAAPSPVIGGMASLAVTISKSASFNPNIEHGKIRNFRVKIEGEGIAEPIVAEFPGDAVSGTIEGVPAGEDRIVSVEAINGNALTIRAGEARDVEIDGGENTVSVSLDAVPIFTNLTDKSAIDNTRLVFKLFSDPEHPVMVEETGAKATILADASTNLTDIWVDSSTGLGVLSPAIMPPGEHAFRAKDAVTGKYSTVNVTLLDGAKKRPAPFASAASQDTAGTQRLGN